MNHQEGDSAQLQHLFDKGELACPLCGKAHQMHKAKKLYGYFICPDCYYGFASRRELAFVVDYCVLSYSSTLIVKVMNPIDLSVLVMDVSLLVTAWFLLKDGLGFLSPGKLLLGLKVVDRDSGSSAGLWQSFKRNLPMLIPFAILFMVFELGLGYRTGDGWANTKVIWKKFAKKPVFLSTSDLIEIDAKYELAQAVFDRAVAFESIGEFDDAISFYSQVIEQAPDTEVARDAQAALDAINQKRSSNQA